MANLYFYKKYLNLSSTEEICQALSDSLIETNCTYDFFVNWDKVTTNRNTFKYELALLKSLNSSTNPISDFRNLLLRYPEVIKVIPILIACRDGFLKVLSSIEEHFQYLTFDFNKYRYSDNEVDEIVRFTKNTGLLDMLCQMESTTDYLLGVEVGLDTNARKNRSGLFLERLVTETLEELASRNRSIIIEKQKTFDFIEKKYGSPIPASLRDRKFDYSIIIDGKATNIEVNFYSGTGSKPSEIISSYINRGEVLTSSGWRFVWLTDGQGWKKMQRQFHVGVENMDYVINTSMLRKGILGKILLFPFD